MSMKTRVLTKPDGRLLRLYSRQNIDAHIQATSPEVLAQKPNPHLRWHPLRGEWVSYASHRQNRTFMPPKEYNPLAPTRSLEFPTELPSGRYDAAVFENLFPTLSLAADDNPCLEVPTRPAKGVCEVVVFTQDPETSLGHLPLDHIELLLEVWADRSADLGARPEIQYVMPFENRGVEMGVTLSHPHGQIYAYPFVPPVPAQRLSQESAHWNSAGRGLLEDLIQGELKEKRRLLYEDADALAFVPVCARYPYETWVAPKRRLAAVQDLDATERRAFARALKTVLLKYDGLWNRSFPYLMIFCQAPSDGQAHPETHFHLELFPPYRSRDRLKYLAGTELGAGMFANDSLPEEKAAELQAVEVRLDSPQDLAEEARL